MRTAILATLALSLAGCGDPLFFAEVEERRICLQVSSTLPGTGVNVNVGEQTVDSPVGSIDVASQIAGLDKAKDATTASVRLTSLSVSSAGDLSFVAAAEVDLSDANGQLAPFVHYAAPAGQAAPVSRIDMVVDDPNVNLYGRLVGGALSYQLHVTGTPPAAETPVDVTARMYVKVLVDALKAAQAAN